MVVVLSGRKPTLGSLAAGAGIGCVGGLAVLGAWVVAAPYIVAGGAATATTGGAAATQLGRSIESLENQLATGTGPWVKAATHIEQATSRAKRLSGGMSREEFYVHSETGEKLFRHTIVKNGEVLHERIRDFSKAFR
jgi:hypothetical protein